MRRNKKKGLISEHILPDELWRIIFSFTTRSTRRYILTRVCKRWNFILQPHESTSCKYGQGCLSHKHYCADKAARKGHLLCLKFALDELPFQMTYNLLEISIRTKDIKQVSMVLKYGNKDLQINSLCAAEVGYLSIFKLLYENGFFISPYIYTTAVDMNNAELIEFAYAHCGAPNDILTLIGCKSLY